MPWVSYSFTATNKATERAEFVASKASVIGLEAEVGRNARKLTAGKGRTWRQGESERIWILAEQAGDVQFSAATTNTKLQAERQN